MRNRFETTELTEAEQIIETGPQQIRKLEDKDIGETICPKDY